MLFSRSGRVFPCAAHSARFHGKAVWRPRQYDLIAMSDTILSEPECPMDKSVPIRRPIDEHAIRIPKDSGLLPCLYVPIAARDANAIEKYVGRIAGQLLSRLPGQ